MGLVVAEVASFVDADTSPSEPVVLINRATAGRFFGGRDPLGQKIEFWDSGGRSSASLATIARDGGGRCPRVLAYLVAQRTREIGGRHLVAIGLAAGFSLALVFGRPLSGMSALRQE